MSSLQLELEELLNRGDFLRAYVTLSKISNPSLSVEKYVEKMTVEEAAARVFRKLNHALARMEKTQREILQHHFSGVTVSQLSDIYQISEQEAVEWIKSAKRELIRQIKESYQIKN